MSRNVRYTPYTYKKKYLEQTYDLKDFDPNRTDYTEAELKAYSDMMLWDDKGSKTRAEWKDGPEILFQEHIENRWNREVPNAAGIADDAITHSQSPDGQTLYKRTHPEGRKVNSLKQQTTNGAAYFR